LVVGLIAAGLCTIGPAGTGCVAGLVVAGAEGVVAASEQDSKSII
jgi:hypothetical protein